MDASRRGGLEAIRLNYEDRTLIWSGPGGRRLVDRYQCPRGHCRVAQAQGCRLSGPQATESDADATGQTTTMMCCAGRAYAHCVQYVSAGTSSQWRRERV